MLKRKKLRKYKKDIFPESIHKTGNNTHVFYSREGKNPKGNIVMKIFSGKESEPVPSRVGTVIAIIVMTIISSSASAVEAAVKEGWEPPVLTAEGSVVKPRGI